MCNYVIPWHEASLNRFCICFAVCVYSKVYSCESQETIWIAIFTCGVHDVINNLGSSWIPHTTCDKRACRERWTRDVEHYVRESTDWCSLGAILLEAITRRLMRGWDSQFAFLSWLCQGPRVWLWFLQPQTDGKEFMKKGGFLKTQVPCNRTLWELLRWHTRKTWRNRVKWHVVT